MTNVAEAAEAPLEMAAGLQLGVDTLSKDQQVTFIRYIRLVLPLDGYVFWVRADQLSASALFNAARYNAERFNQAPTLISDAAELTVKGSLHFTSDVHQDEDRTAVWNAMVFTSEERVNDLSEIGPNEIYVAHWNDQRFAFRQRSMRYYQAGLHHYRGDALYSVMDTQLVDDPATLNTNTLIVSNSLPIWLSLFGTTGLGPAQNPNILLFPSFLVPLNEPPPYGAVHIPPDSTRALAAAPTLGRTLQHDQLCAETVKFTIYGERNAAALDFQDYLFQYSLETDLFGVMNMPVIRDEKLTQAELGIIAQKKSLTVEISYHQQQARNIARQLILSAMINLSFGD